MSVRLQVQVSEQLVNEIDEYASEIGISRAAMAAVLMKNALEAHQMQKNTCIPLKSRSSPTMTAVINPEDCHYNGKVSKEANED